MLRWISLVLCAGAFACASDSQEADKTDAGLNSNVTPCVHTTTDSVARRDSDTLPTGACTPDPDEPECKLVLRDCPCVNVQSPRSLYTCTCTGGSWSCTLTSQDLGACPAPDSGSCELGDGDS
jgi:hypothetical protein